MTSGKADEHGFQMELMLWLSHLWHVHEEWKSRRTRFPDGIDAVVETFRWN
jgi:alpha-D-ribose 1-methylphosphonate 5-triphosphate synthase subunit PhnH